MIRSKGSALEATFRIDFELSVPKALLWIPAYAGKTAFFADAENL
jgi:hypothetical protein